MATKRQPKSMQEMNDIVASHELQEKGFEQAEQKRTNRKSESDGYQKEDIVFDTTYNVDDARLAQHTSKFIGLSKRLCKSGNQQITVYEQDEKMLNIFGHELDVIVRYDKLEQKKVTHHKFEHVTFEHKRDLGVLRVSSKGILLFDIVGIEQIKTHSPNLRWIPVERTVFEL